MIWAFICIVFGSIIFVLTSANTDEENIYITGGSLFMVKLVFNLLGALLFILAAIIMYKNTL